MLIVLLIMLQIVIFAVLIIVMKRVLTQNVVSATKHLEELNEDYSRKEKEVNKQLEEAEKKSQGILNAAQEEVEKAKIKIIKDAQQEKDKILKQAKALSDEMIQQADKSRQALILEIEEKISKGATDRACELIQGILPDKFKQEAHSYWAEELIKTGFAKLEQLRIPQDVNEVKIASAFSLTDEQREVLFKKLKEVLNRDITLKEEIDPNLVAGIVISIGSLILDGSLKNKIQERAKIA